MKKRLLLFVGLLFSTFLFAQEDYKDVVELLLQNKRAESRKLFDKKFSKKKDSSVDLLFLDAIIDEESGRLAYDETLLRKIENLPNSGYYIDPYINDNFVAGDIQSEEYDDLTFKKVDFLASSPVFKDKNIVKYRKGYLDQVRYRMKESLESYSKLNTITDWQFCGVFENMNGSGLDIEYEPESKPVSKEMFNANSNGYLNWYDLKSKFVEGYQFFLNEKDYGEGIIYAQTFVEVPETKTYLMQFGLSSSMKIFIDDTEVISKYETGKTNLDAFNYELELTKGIHRLLIKLELSTETDYFSCSLKNTDYSVAKELKFYNSYQVYPKYSFNLNSVVEKNLDFEHYFIEKVKSQPNNALFKIFLYKAYMANRKKDKALEAIENLAKLYPKSSMLLKYLAEYYSADENYQKVQELHKNIENNDKSYYYSILLKIRDKSWTRNSQISEIEKYWDLAKELPESQYDVLFDFLIKSRKSDIDGMLAKIEEVVRKTHNSSKNKTLLASLYVKLKNDVTKAQTILEDVIEERQYSEAIFALYEIYYDSNKIDKANELILDLIKNNPNVNLFRDIYIDVLIDQNKYDEALKLIDTNLEYFPYSYSNMERKGTVYSYLNDKKKAVEYYEKALSHYSSNSSLRKKLYDLTNKVDEIQKVEVVNIYDYIKKHRGTQLTGNYGVVMLLDEFIVNVLSEGGLKTKARYIYEIISENGIEELKEYSLNYYSVNLIKNEVVKKNGTIVPAEKGDGTLVFSNLEVGDVIYIEYDYNKNSYGRFYKDFNSNFTVKSSYPIEKFYYTIIHPKDMKVNTFFKNGTTEFKESKIENKIVKQWYGEKVEGLALLDPFSPDYEDLTQEIYTGTIDSWEIIANWYSDLVKKNIKWDRITQQTFDEIFSKGFEHLSETERASKIYEYIEKNITYSFLDFRQSGYVPQKPSKTLETKLGDCKDLSALFVTLAKKANVKSNLVLVLTNDYGLKTLPLPTTAFNHCIVKANLDGKEYFLELTDKYLPFKALPRSLYKANALVVNLDNSKNIGAQLTSIPFTNALTNVKHSKTVINVTDDSKKITMEYTAKGDIKSYYNELFSTATTEEVRVKEIENECYAALNKTIKNLNYKFEPIDFYSDDINFSYSFNIEEKLQKIGDLRMIQIPFYEKVYTKNIVAKETRNYPIDYAAYENTNHYLSEIVINVDENFKFLEVPENKELKFKDHLYKIVFELVKPNQLKIVRDVKLSWSDISPEEYLKFKEYASQILEIEGSFIGFK